jgi:hypothetical protein
LERRSTGDAANAVHRTQIDPGLASALTLVAVIVIAANTPMM